jgi:hypothetical protein
MSQFVSDELVRVPVGPCQCPGTPHDGQDGRDDGDVVFLQPALTLDGGLEVLRALRKTEEGEDLVSFATRMVPPYLRHGLAAWNFVDERGKPIAVTAEAIRHLKWEMAYTIGDKADDLYGEEALRPLLARMQKPSPPGQKAGSTSPNRASRRARQPRSGRSSPASSAATKLSAT